MFIDEINITVESGVGGKGCESFFVRTDHKRVPNGGNGGKGGDIIFRADENVTGLDDFLHKRIIKAEPGGSGGANLKTGRSSDPVILKIPCGTFILNRESNLRIRDLVDHGDEVIVAEGGKGGTGNQHGQLLQAPGKGQIVQLSLTVKLASDVVLLGLPNSGKSLLLRGLTNAQAKVETYPFSTQAPQLGIMESSGYGQLKICELPGLLKGASEGKGLGNKFLRHLERTRLIVLVLDPFNEYALSMRESYKVILHELKLHAENILDIPRLIVVNKSDKTGFSKYADSAQASFKETVIAVSALSGTGLDKLKLQLEKTLL